MENSKVKQRKLKTVIKWASCMIVFALTIEICARIDDCIKYDAPFFSGYTVSRLRTVDADGIQINVPDIGFEKWQNNKYGFRGSEFETVKSDDVTRIVCMGTSETYGLTESPGMDWSVQLSAMLEDKGRYEVINASVVGLPLDQFRAYMDKYVFKFKPDIIYFLINPYSYVARLERPSRREAAPANLTGKQQAGWDFSLSSIINNVRVLPKTKQVVKKFMPLAALHAYQLWISEKELRQAEERILVDKAAKDFVPEEFLAQYERDVEELIEYAAGKDIKIIIGSYPVLLVKDNLGRYPDLDNASRTYMVEFSLEGMVDITTKLDSVTEVIALNNGYGFVDNRLSPPHDTEHYADGVHCTDAGSTLLAKNVLDYIVTLP